MINQPTPTPPSGTGAPEWVTQPAPAAPPAPAPAPVAVQAPSVTVTATAPAAGTDYGAMAQHLAPFVGAALAAAVAVVDAETLNRFGLQFDQGLLITALLALGVKASGRV